MAMVDTFRTLVRLSKHKVEKAQEALAVAEKESLRIAQWLQATESSRQQSLQAAATLDDVRARLDAGHYDQRLKLMVDKLRGELAAAEAVAVEKRQALTLVYAEQERHALLLAKEEAQIRKRRADKQQAQLDEVAGRSSFK